MRLLLASLTLAVVACSEDTTNSQGSVNGDAGSAGHSSPASGGSDEGGGSSIVDETGGSAGAGTGGDLGSGGAGTGTGGAGGSDCPMLPSCNWCGGEDVMDANGCVTGWICANGVDPCEDPAGPCWDTTDCAADEVCEDELCWPDPPTGQNLSRFEWVANPCTTDPCLSGLVGALVEPGTGVTHIIVDDAPLQVTRRRQNNRGLKSPRFRGGRWWRVAERRVGVGRTLSRRRGAPTMAAGPRFASRSRTADTHPDSPCRSQGR